MSQKQISQWRSVGFSLLVAILLTSAFVWVALDGKTNANVEAMFGSLCTFAWVTVLAAFGKSLGEKAADGTGLKGIARVLMTEQRPGEPAKEDK